MTDEKNDDSVVKPITDYVPKTRLRQQHVPKSRRNQDAREQLPPTTAQVKEWITAGALAAGQKVYTELAEQHRNVFEMQEAGVMAVLEGLHGRLCVLESQAGIASPDLGSLREAFEAAITSFQNGGATEEELATVGPCTHDHVDDGNPAKCLTCGENVSISVGPRVEVDEEMVAAVRAYYGESWNDMTIVQRRVAVQAWAEVRCDEVVQSPTEPVSEYSRGVPTGDVSGRSIQ